MYRNTILLFYHSLLDLGHDVTVNQNRVYPDSLNLFVPPMAYRSQGLVDGCVGNRIKYGFIGVELCSRYLHGMPPDYKDNDSIWEKFVENASLIFCIFKADINEYAQYTDKAVYTPYGFHEKCFEIPQISQKNLDVFFFGDSQHRPYRQKILNALVSKGLKVEVLSNPAASQNCLIRNSFIARAKININLADPGHVSPQRVVYLANNKIQPVSNIVNDADNYLDYALSFQDDELVDACLDYIADKKYLSTGEYVYEKCKANPMIKNLEKIFCETLP